MLKSYSIVDHYKIIKQELMDFNSFHDFSTKINELLRTGYQPYESPSLTSFNYPTGSAYRFLSQAFIKTSEYENQISEYIVIFGQDIENEVNSWLKKGYFLYGSLLSLVFVRNGFGTGYGCTYMQVVIKIKHNITEEEALSIYS